MGDGDENSLGRAREIAVCLFHLHGTTENRRQPLGCQHLALHA